MKIETANNGYIVHTEDFDVYVFKTKAELFEYLDKNIVNRDSNIIVKGCDITK